jgi:hypothetical protein
MTTRLYGNSGQACYEEPRVSKDKPSHEGLLLLLCSRSVITALLRDTVASTSTYHGLNGRK